MAVTKTVLKKTQTEAVVKVAGTPASTPAATIDLDTDLVASTEAAGTAGTQEVQITGVTWSGVTGSSWSISRNGVVIMSLLCTGGPGHLDFTGEEMIPDSIENDQDIVVTVAGGQAEVWLRLRKSAGYNTKIQPEQFGIYDDQTSTSS